MRLASLIHRHMASFEQLSLPFDRISPALLLTKQESDVREETGLASLV
jgi:hypothetical protein